MAARPSSTRLLPVLLGVGLILFFVVGAGAFAFWKFYWLPRSQQTETVDQSLASQVPDPSKEPGSAVVGQTESPIPESSAPMQTSQPAEMASPDVRQETGTTDSNAGRRSATDVPVSPVRRADSGPARPVRQDEYPASPVIATQDSPVSNSLPSVPVDSGQTDRPVSQPVIDDSPAPSAANESVTDRPVETPPVSEPIRSQPPRYEGPNRGTLVWTGDVVKGDQVMIENDSANRGTVRGALPGVPCTISLNSANVAVFEAPGPRNRYRRVGLRFNQNGRLSVVVTWEVIK